MRRIIQVVERTFRLLLWVLVSPIIITFPRDRKKILFGAWHGKQYSCNPKYLFEYIARRGGYKCIWIGDEELRCRVLQCPGAKFARKGSLAALWHALTASFFAYNVNWREDIINFPRFRRVELLYLTHGYADKYVGIKQYGGNGARIQTKKSFQSLRSILNWCEELLYGNQSWCSESSEQGVNIRLSNQPFIMSKNCMLRFGKPRADYFINNRTNQNERVIQKKKIGDILGVPINKKWYLYVPTWRHNCRDYFSFSTSLSFDNINRFLDKQNAIIIEKQHPIVLRNINIPFGKSGSVFVISAAQSHLIDTQELLMASDCMITDYSSIYYDYVLLNRPVIHFVYDYDEFMTKDMGFNYDMRKYGGGPFVNNIDDLLEMLRLPVCKLLALRSGATQPEHLTYEKGVSCQRYYEFIGKRVEERSYFVH